MRRRGRTLATALTLSLATAALAACGSGEAPSGEGAGATGGSRATVSVTHAQGTTEVPLKPTKVAVLDFGALDSVTSVGAGDAVAGLPKKALPAFLGTYKDSRYADLGTLQEPDVEKLATAKPDLIIVGGRSAAKYKELSAIAPTIDLTVASKGDLVANAKKVNETVGRVFGKEAEVAAKHKALDAKITATKAKGANAGTGLILMTSGGKLSAFGPVSRFGLIHTALGVRPTGAPMTEDRHGQAASFEYVKAAHPDRLFVVDRDAAIGQSGKAATQVLDNPLVDSTPAASTGHITYLDGQRWYVTGAGLDNLAAMVDEVAAGL